MKFVIAGILVVAGIVGAGSLVVVLVALGRASKDAAWKKARFAYRYGRWGGPYKGDDESDDSSAD